MNRFLLPLLALSFAAAPAQSFTLLLRHGPGDLVLNAPLAEAIAAEPEVGTALRTLLGAELQKLGNISLTMPATHLPGTYQIHGFVDLALAHSPEPAMQQKIVDAVVAHLVERLSYLLYEEPRGSLGEQSEQLQLRIVELSTQLAMLKATSRQRQAAADAAQSALEQATTRLREARIRVATTANERIELEDMRKSLQARASALQQKRTELSEQRNTLLAEVEGLKRSYTGNTTPQETVDRLMRATQRVADLESKQADLDAQQAELQTSLTPVLSRLPEAVVTQVRTETEAKVAEAQHAELEKQAAEAGKLLQDAFAMEAELQRTTIDLDVCRALLTEVQGKLARLRPLHVELIRN